MSAGSGARAGLHPLAPILSPRSVVVVGASRNPRKRGFQAVRALSEAGFEGPIYPLNPKGGELLGRTVFPSLDDLPEAPDLALICTPAATVPAAVEACGRIGVLGAVVLAVGFRESGEEGAALERDLLARARATGIRIVGPNTSGILNMPLGLNLIGARGVRSGGLSLLVQSGNIALGIMNELAARSAAGIAICVGVGNELDLRFHEYLDFLEHHEPTRAIIAHAEGFRDAPAFLRAAARLTRHKPVILIKGARSRRGQVAARSHTGAVAGRYDRLRAGLRQAGIVEVMRTDELLPVAETLAFQPVAPVAGGVAILSDGGGQGALAADALEERKVPLATLAETSQATLRALLGRAGAVTNPVDLAGAADSAPEVFADALAVLARDGSVEGVLVVGLFGGYGIRFSDELGAGEVRAARGMVEIMRECGKPLVVHSMYAASGADALRTLRNGGVPVIESLDVACRCIGATHERSLLLARPDWPPREEEALSGGAGAEAATEATGLPSREWLARARDQRRESLTEPETRSLLEASGLRFQPAVLCRTAAEAEDAARRTGGTVALKVVSTGIAHKTEAGGVVLGLSPAEVRPAWEGIVERARAYLRAAGLEEEIQGVLVTPMLPNPLAELIVGAQRDPDLGPVLTLGAGGVWTEVLLDASHRVLPVRDETILEMLAELRTYPILTGARGRPAANLGSIVEAAQCVARCLRDNPEVTELEVNPLFAYETGVEPADARAFLENPEPPGTGNTDV